MFENQKKVKYGSKRNCFINLHLIVRLDIEFTAFYKRADARGSVDIIYSI